MAGECARTEKCRRACGTALQIASDRHRALVLVVLAVSVLSVTVLTRYSHALEKVFHENYDSALYCDGMKAALDQLNLRAERIIWHDQSSPPIDPIAQEQKFEANLNAQI